MLVPGQYWVRAERMGSRAKGGGMRTESDKSEMWVEWAAAGVSGRGALTDATTPLSRWHGTLTNRQR